MYRPKTPAPAGAESAATPAPKTAAEKPVEQPKVEQIAPKEPRAPKPEKKEKVQAPKPVPAPKQTVVDKQPEAKVAAKAPEATKVVAVKAQAPSVVATQAGAHAPNVSDEVASLQKLLMAKEKEIGKLQKHIDKQDTKADTLANENGQLKEQLKLSSEGDQLKQTVTSLNQQLSKQTALNRLQSSQILEFE